MANAIYTISTIVVLVIIVTIWMIVVKDRGYRDENKPIESVENAKDSIRVQIGDLSNSKKKVVSKNRLIRYLNYLYNLLDGKV